ncbi:MAG: lipopolysaccharide heptosyltransferase I [Gammaproteobacteria bacterium]|nr:MAG: lipopolysaccharide heptosyltransferase I [Gammaproteobacteria bacterium]
MKRVLVVKTSSMGDVVHALPAVTESATHHPGLRFDWVVEPGFADIPALHPRVDRVIPLAFRRLRRHPLAMLQSDEWQQFLRDVRAREYDAVIDAQGLLKSAFIASRARGPLHGMDRRSAREPLASLFYRHRHSVPRGMHAITRQRRLFASVLGHEPGIEFPGYGLDPAGQPQPMMDEPYLFFLQGTTWPTKEWPDRCWVELIRIATHAGWRVVLAATGFEARARAKMLVSRSGRARVLPDMGLAELAPWLAGAAAYVGVDTGLAHLAAALDTPGVTLYGATEPGLTGTMGRGQAHLQVDFDCAPCLSRQCSYRGHSTVYPPCFVTLPPDRVWEALQPLLEQKK